jgi:effector-binding domain-containing protein
MNYEIRLETLATPRPLAIVRRRARPHELPKVVPDACGVVWAAIRAQGISGAGRHVALYLDEQINVEVGVEVDHPIKDRGELIASVLPAGTVATTTHLGPYNQLLAAHRAIRDWCARHNYSRAGPNWELYGHWQEAWNSDPAQIRTDVFYLLAPAATAAD